MPPSRRGTGFTNLQTYLGLNHGIAGDMGNRIAEDVEKVGSEARSAIDTADAEFRGKVDAGGMPAPESATPLTLEEMEARSGVTYAGPKEFGEVADVGSLYGQAAAASNKANALGTNSGRSTLLGEIYGGQNTWGGGQLDAALAGAGSAGGRIEKARKGYGDLVGYLGNVQKSGSEYASGVANKTGEVASWYKGQVDAARQREEQQRQTAEAERVRRQRERLRQNPRQRAEEKRERNTYP